jgi:hypothetical protein
MGFEVNRFQGEVDEELVCPICSGVLEDPLQVRNWREFHKTGTFVAVWWEHDVYLSFILMAVTDESLHLVI